MGPFVKGKKEITYHLSLCHKYLAASKIHPLPPGHNLQIKINVSDSDRYSWNKESIEYLLLFNKFFSRFFFSKLGEKKSSSTSALFRIGVFLKLLCELRKSSQLERSATLHIRFFPSFK